MEFRRSFEIDFKNVYVGYEKWTFKFSDNAILEVLQVNFEI